MTVVATSIVAVTTALPGTGYVSGESPGVTTVAGTPTSIILDLLRRSDHAWLKRQASHDDGTYYFGGLPLDVEYDLIGRDVTGTWEDAITSRVLPYTPPIVTTTSLAFTVGVPATTQMTSQYGEAPIVWTIDTTPPGLSMSTAGLWSGTPTTAGSTAVVVTATDAYSEVGTKAFNVVVT